MKQQTKFRDPAHVPKFRDPAHVTKFRDPAHVPRILAKALSPFAV